MSVEEIERLKSESAISNQQTNSSGTGKSLAAKGVRFILILIFLILFAIVILELL